MVSSTVDVGTVVDVWWHAGWWEGIVVMKDSEDKVHVYFPGENQEAVFGNGDLRNSQEWVGNGWTLIKEGPDLVGTILTCLDKMQDVDQSPACNSVQTAIYDGRQITKDDPEYNNSNLDSRNEGPTNSLQVLDLSRDYLLSRLRWKSYRRRSVLRKVMESLAFVRCLFPASSKVDHENCKCVGNSLFNSRTLTSLVMSR